MGGGGASTRACGAPSGSGSVIRGRPPVFLHAERSGRGTRLRWLAGRRLHDGRGTRTKRWKVHRCRSRARVGRRSMVAARPRQGSCAATTAADRAPRGPQRVWTLASGGIKWLDDPAADAAAPADSVASDQQLLIAFARNALGREGRTGDRELRVSPPTSPRGLSLLRAPCRRAVAATWMRWYESWRP